MICAIVSIVLFLVIAGYLFVWPVAKNRPAVLNRAQIMISVFLLLASLSFFLDQAAYVVASFAAVCFIWPDSWLVYGITSQMAGAALEKAALATREPFLRRGNDYTLGGDTVVALREYKKVMRISFKSAKPSKKTKLTKTVFGKFINNNRIRVTGNKKVGV